MNMAIFISHSPAQTEAFAQSVGKNAQPGWVIGLLGDLGAGKTQFVKGLAQGLGVTELVLSPTFALVHAYTSGRLPLHHLDFYRLESQAQIIAAGLDQYLTPPGVAVIEWWDRWQNPDPPFLRRFRLEALNETDRSIAYDDFGA